MAVQEINQSLTDFPLLISDQTQMMAKIITDVGKERVDQIRSEAGIRGFSTFNIYQRE